MHTNSPEYVRLLITTNSQAQLPNDGSDNQGAQGKISKFNLKFKCAMRWELLIYSQRECLCKHTGATEKVGKLTEDGSCLS